MRDRRVQALVLRLQAENLLDLYSADPRPGVGVNLDLADPPAQTLPSHPELGVDRHTRRSHRPVVIEVVTNQPHRASLELRVVLLGHIAILHHKQAASDP